MKLEYVLNEIDFINFHLFSISENKNSLISKKTIKTLLVSVFLFLCINMYLDEKIELAILFGIVVILTFIFFDKLYRAKLKNHFSKIVKNAYSARIGEKETMEFTPEFLITEDKTGQGKTKISEIEKIHEIENNFFVKLSNGSSFIISKRGMYNIDEIKGKWNDLNIPMSENLSWEWN